MTHHDCFLRRQEYYNCSRIFHYVSALKEQNPVVLLVDAVVHLILLKTYVINNTLIMLGR